MKSEPYNVIIAGIVHSLLKKNELQADIKMILKKLKVKPRRLLKVNEQLENALPFLIKVNQHK